MANQLEQIQHVVVLMLENRSFDHMLGLLYADQNNVSPAGQPFDGLSGAESNPADGGEVVKVYAINASQTDAYFQPGADPGEGYFATNSQLFGSTNAPSPPLATNQGFVSDYAYTIGWESQKPSWSVLPGTVVSDIMGVFTPAMLPVLSGLARGYAVCDQWFSSVPTETLPNRAFVCAATSQGHMDDTTKSYTSQSIFGLMSKHNQSWAIYGYDQQPLTRLNFPDTTAASDDHFGLFSDFAATAKSGTLPAYTFLEPSWDAAGNSQHPNYDVALGEQLIHDVYYALRSNTEKWNQTLLIVTYDEHGGCYDHVPPPRGAVPPDSAVGEYSFDFKRFGVRVPTLLISPLIAPGTVFRVASQSMPLDHTSILKTIEERWLLPSLTARDAAAQGIGDVLTLLSPRSDDPLSAVVVPRSSGDNLAANQPSHLQQVHAELVARLPVPDSEGGMSRQVPALQTNAELARYIESRTAQWLASHRTGAA